MAIDLIVRGVCCLRPGVKGVSERITVRSIVDRFLDTAASFILKTPASRRVFAGSADWMPRNFFRRIEVVFPGGGRQFARAHPGRIAGDDSRDNVKARFLQPNGAYRRLRRRPGQAARRSQNEFIQLAQSPPPAGAAARTNAAQFARFKLAPSPFAAPPG